MALKDWKKIREDTWKNINSKDELTISRFGDKYIIMLFYKNTSNLIFYKFSKNRKQALKYVKEYMKKHR